MAEPVESPPGSSRKQQVSRRAQKLSEERLARKRELDRQAQRSARVKTKNHIAHLESRIEALTRVQGSGDVKGLIDQIEEQRKENEALKATIKTIGKLVGNTGDNGERCQCFEPPIDLADLRQAQWLRVKQRSRTRKLLKPQLTIALTLKMCITAPTIGTTNSWISVDLRMRMIWYYRTMELAWG
jgi:hypothetical protein